MQNNFSSSHRFSCKSSSRQYIFLKARNAFPSQLTERKQRFADLGEYNIQGSLHVSAEEEEKNKIALEFNYITR